MLVVGLGTLMSSVDATVTNVALHTVGRDLGSSIGDVQWVATGYLLTLASVIPVSGWIARRFGARRVYTIALALFAASSGLCAAASTLGELVAFRALQGVAAGVILCISQLIAAEVAGPEQMGRMMSRIWMVTGLGSVLGPILGGVIIAGLGWRWIFLINVPIGVVATLAAVRYLPRTPPRPAGPLDVSGLVRLGLGIPSIVFALAQAEATNKPLAPSTLIPLLAGIALTCDFVRHALRAKHPLLDLRLYARRTFATGSMALFCLNVVWFGVAILLPLYFQQVRHASPAQAGLLLAPQGIGTVTGNWFAGRIRNHLVVRRLAAVGVLGLAATTMTFAHMGPGTPEWVIWALLLVSGFGAGVAWVAGTAAGYVDLERERISHAAPLLATVMRVGASFGTALAAIVLQHELAVVSDAGSQAHVVAAYHTTFKIAVSAALIALAMFIALCRSQPEAAPRIRHDTAEFETVAAV
jgi:EmrB/QacA subfamily drug resistance transporter